MRALSAALEEVHASIEELPDEIEVEARINVEPKEEDQEEKPNVNDATVEDIIMGESSTARQRVKKENRQNEMLE
jgi:hypothetical protein